MKNRSNRNEESFPDRDKGKRESKTKGEKRKHNEEKEETAREGVFSGMQADWGERV